MKHVSKKPEIPQFNAIQTFTLKLTLKPNNMIKINKGKSCLSFIKAWTYKLKKMHQNKLHRTIFIWKSIIKQFSFSCLNVNLMQICIKFMFTHDIHLKYKITTHSESAGDILKLNLILTAKV